MSVNLEVDPSAVEPPNESVVIVDTLIVVLQRTQLNCRIPDLQKLEVIDVCSYKPLDLW